MSLYSEVIQASSTLVGLLGAILISKLIDHYGELRKQKKEIEDTLRNFRNHARSLLLDEVLNSSVPETDNKLKLIKLREGVLSVDWANPKDFNSLYSQIKEYSLFYSPLTNLIGMWEGRHFDNLYADYFKKLTPPLFISGFLILFLVAFFGVVVPLLNLYGFCSILLNIFIFCFILLFLWIFWFLYIQRRDSLIKVLMDK